MTKKKKAKKIYPPIDESKVLRWDFGTAWEIKPLRAVLNAEYWIRVNGMSFNFTTDDTPTFLKICMFLGRSIRFLAHPGLPFGFLEVRHGFTDITLKIRPVQDGPEPVVQIDVSPNMSLTRKVVKRPVFKPSEKKRRRRHEVPIQTDSPVQ